MSYDIKQVDLGEERKTRFWENPEHPVGRIYYFFDDLIWKVWGKPKMFLTKLYSYAKMMWVTGDYDFDAHSIYPLIELKLKRVRESLKNGRAIQDPKDMKALDLCIKLSRRLYEDKYWEKRARKHEEKWGESDMITTPASYDDKGNPLTYSIDFTRTNANTPEEKEQERKEMLESAYLEEEIKQRERIWLFEIMAKYLPTWWD